MSFLKKLKWNPLIVRWMGISLLLHGLAAWRSVGFNDMDEHFQILEFLSYRIGRGVLTDLPYEFAAQVRSFFQVGLYELIVRFWLALGVDSPAFWAFFIRLTTGLIGWASTLALILAFRRELDTPMPHHKARKHFGLALMLGTLLYFFPYIHVRPSGESLGGSLFFAGVALFLLLDRQKAWITGAVLGFAFLCRFQMGFAIAGFGAWCLWQRTRWSTLLQLAAGLCVAIGIGVLVDYHGYGAWVFTPWSYFKTSFLMGVAAAGGVSPWWTYFKFLGYDVPYIGQVIAGFVILFWIRWPRHILTWTTLPFFVLHSLVGHKEPRYLYPLVTGLPVILALSYGSFRSLIAKRVPAFIQRWPLRLITGLLLALNGGGLFVATLKPATTQPLFQNYVFAHRDEIRTLHFIQTNPFVTIGINMYFYRPPGLVMHELRDLTALRAALKGGASPLWVAYPSYEFAQDPDLARMCELRFSVFPSWLKAFNFLPGIRNSASRLSLYRCTGEES